MYHVHSFEPGLYTVGTGTLGVDWNPIADFDSLDVAHADAERRNSPYIYALLETARQQIDAAIERLEVLEAKVARAARVDNENSPDFHGY